LKPDDASPQKENEKNTPEATIAEMAQLYKDASAYPEKNFYIAFTEKGGIEGKGSSDEAMNSGYTPREMAQMFYEARNQDGVGGSIPSNIHFHDKFLNLMKTS